MISPRWPEGILFGHAERSYRKTVLSGVDALTLKRVAVVPWHPLGWVFFQLLQMALQLGEIVEGVGAAEFGSVDQAHEHVSDPCTVFSQIKQAVFPMKNGLLQSSFADVVINRGAGLAQKQGKPLPMVEQIVDGSAQARVRLDLLLFQLSHQPLVQLLHHWSAVLLVKEKSFFRG